MNDVWKYSSDHGQICQVIESQTLWSETTCRVWLPGLDSVVRVPVFRLSLLENSGTGTAHQISALSRAIAGDRVYCYQREKRCS